MPRPVLARVEGVLGELRKFISSKEGPSYSYAVAAQRIYTTATCVAR
jgi:hypothetical protein